MLTCPTRRKVLAPVLLTTLIALTPLGGASRAFAAAAPLQLPRPSQKSELNQVVGLTKISLIYSRPGVKNRTIWGDLVPYDKVWRTGANEATQFSVSTDVKLNGQALKAGSYSLHMLPTKGNWTVIINRVADQWGSYDYKESEDALRFNVTPVPHEMTEWMQFSFTDLAVDKATLVLDWDKLRVPIEITVDTVGQAMIAARAAMASLDAKDDGTARRCAQFAFDNNQAPDEAMQWVDKSIAIKPGWLNLRLKANMLAKQGKYKDAATFGQRSIDSGKVKGEEAPAEDMDRLAKLVAEWKAKG